MTGNVHVQFGIGGGEGDLSADHTVNNDKLPRIIARAVVYMKRCKRSVQTRGFQGFSPHRLSFSTGLRRAHQQKVAL
jgi:hypothetical protein